MQKVRNWLIADRCPDVSIKQAMHIMCMARPRDLTPMQTLRRIAEEEDAKQPGQSFSWRTLPGLLPRG
ncbi:MAG: hypothetical protein Fur0040_04050 [Sideroxydans sp.]